MKYTTNNIDDNVLELSLEVEPNDYMPKVNEELKQIRKTREFKGFRKGKTPMSFIKRIFGNNILVSELSKLLDKKIDEYLKENKIEFLLSPIPKEEQSFQNLNINNVENFNYTLEIHKKPEIDIKGTSKEDEYTSYNIEIDDKLIDEQIKNFKIQFGKYENYEGDEITDDVFITISAEEISDDNDEHDPHSTVFKIKVEEISDEYKDIIKKAGKEKEFEFDIYKLTKDYDENMVRKYLLNIDEGDEDKSINNMFKGKITKAEIYKEAELNEETFKKANLEDVKNEEDLREYFKNLIKKQYDGENKRLVSLIVLDKIIELNDVDISRDFVERWMKTVNQQGENEINDKLIDDKVKELKMQTLYNILFDKYDIKVDDQEVIDKMREDAIRMLNTTDEYYINQLIEVLLKNEEVVQKTLNDLYMDKLADSIYNDITLKEEKISWDDFVKIVNEYNASKNNSEEEE